MTAQEFATPRLNTFVKSPHGILGQCVSVPSEFAVQNGWPELYGAGDATALEIWNLDNETPPYQKIVNTPAGYPVAGDFLFFSGAYGGGAGHTGLVMSADTATITLFEQNDPYQSPAHYKAYNYANVLGWFRHPSTPPPPAPTPNAGVYPVRRPVNVRTAPSVTAPIVAALRVGTVQVTEVVTGDQGNVGGRVSNQWGRTLNGHYFCMAATMA